MLARFARRAAIDIGSGVSKLLIVRDNGEPLHRVVEVPFAFDVSQNSNNSLSESIMTQGLGVLRDFKTLCRENNVIEPVVGIATAVFRKASNAQTFIDRARELGIDIRIVSQFEEGRLGLETAIVASGFERSRVVAFDQGGASFQVTSLGGANSLQEQQQQQLNVYEGAFGSISSLGVLVESIRKQSMATIDRNTVNPVQKHEAKQITAIIVDRLPERPRWLNDVQNPQFVAIGEFTSVYTLITTILGRKEFDLNDIDHCLDIVCNKSNDELQKYRQPELVVPKIALVGAVLTKIAPDARVQYFESIGSTLGIISLFEVAQQEEKR